MSWRRTLWICVAWLALVGCERTPRYNVVLITLDTTRADRLSGYGYELDTTPRLDAFTQDALRFEHAVAPTGFTVPSHASIMTGLYPAGHGAVTNGWVLVESNRTLAEDLRQAGYRTGASVAARWVLGARFGFDQGFDVFKEGQRRQRSAAQITDEALHFLDEQDGRPFFLWLHYYDPHCPYTPPRDSRARFASGIDSRVDRGANCGKDSYNRMQLGDEDVRLVRALYDAELHGMDREIGRFIDRMRDDGLLDSTIFVITADHGEQLYDRRLFGHNLTLHEWETRVPLWLRLPQAPEQDRSPVLTPVSLVDIAPTVWDLVGLPPRDGIDGSSLLAPPNDRAVFSRIAPEGSADRVAVRSGSWKLQFTPGQDDRELYDLSVDPGERNNLAGRATEVRDRLMRLAGPWLDTQTERMQAFADQEVSEEIREQLEALGYIGP